MFGSYSNVDYDSILRTGFGPAGALPIATVNGVTNFGNALNLALSPTLRDWHLLRGRLEYHLVAREGSGYRP